MSYEGAQLGGVLLPEKEFKEAITLLLKQEEKEILAALKNILSLIKEGNIHTVFIAWDNFQEQYLKNNNVELLSILNFYGKDYSQEWRFDAKESDVITPEGKISLKTAVEDSAKEVYYSKILGQHLFNLYNSVQKDIVKYKEETLEALNYSKQSKSIKEHLNEIKYGDKNYTYKNLIYGQKSAEFMWRGKVADAFVNHLGKHHPEIFINRNTAFTSLADKINLNKTVQMEEDSVSFGFLHLLIDSLNNTGWWTGGDLIITDSSGKVIANIQLKTSKGGGDWIGNIKTAQLEKAIIKVVNDIESNSKTIADSFYDMLKTSTVSEQLGDATIETAYNMVIKTLGIKS